MRLEDFVGKNPFDRAAWPEQITAKVVQPGAAPRLCGYDLHRDLARNYRWSETVSLALTGELPEPRWAPALEIALIFLSSVTVVEAPGHAAVLAGFCGTINSAATGIVAIALAEQARAFVERYRALPRAEVSASDDPGIAELRARLGEQGLHDLALETRLGVPGAAVSLLSQCGLSTAAQLEAAWVMARLPVALAEAWAQPPGQFARYPTQLPRFAYHHPRQERT